MVRTGLQALTGPADSAGVTLVTTDSATYLVTSDASQATTSAVGAALNTHASMSAGLRDAVRRMAAIDPAGG